MINFYDFVIKRFNNSNCLYCNKKVVFDHIKHNNVYTDGTVSIHCSCISYYLFNYNSHYINGQFSGILNTKHTSSSMFLDCNFDYTFNANMKSNSAPYVSIYIGNSVHNRRNVYQETFDNLNNFLNSLNNIDILFDKCKKILPLF